MVSQSRDAANSSMPAALRIQAAPGRAVVPRDFRGTVTAATATTRKAAVPTARPRALFAARDGGP